MDISKVKFFVHRNLSTNEIYFANDVVSMQSIEYYDIGLLGVIETVEGDVLFNIEWNNYGELIVMRKFMHLKSFLRFFRNEKRRFLDIHSQKYIEAYIVMH